MMLLFYGSQHIKMTTHAYTSTLALIGIITGIHIFCFLIIYQFRKNLAEERNIRRQNSGSSSNNDASDNANPTHGFNPTAPYIPGKYLLMRELFMHKYKLVIKQCYP